MPIVETLFASSTVLLFGRPFTGLVLPVAVPGGPPVVLGPPAVLPAPANPQLARIYGFSYLGSYHKLAEPTVLLVYSPAVPVPLENVAGAFADWGVEFKSETFPNGIEVWTQDRSDYSVRIDVTPGWLGDILLEPGLRDGTNMMTGRGPESGGGGGSLTGRAAMAGRACMVGRGNCG